SGAHFVPLLEFWHGKLSKYEMSTSAARRQYGTGVAVSDSFVETQSTQRFSAASRSLQVDLKKFEYMLLHNHECIHPSRPS
ncbi:MAG: hypothetical protein MJE68_18355, partial [Proteobacteria bacterium]|nr:hypothetical protein [Pseudomonadota bacterium]